MLVTSACGPSVNEPSSGGSGSSTSAGTTVGSSVGTTGGSSPVSSSGDSTGTTGTSGAVSSEGTSSGGDPYECGCPPSIEIGFDEELGRGLSAADALAAYGDRQLPWVWVAFDGSPIGTTLHLHPEYEGGSVINGPGGTDGCAFLSIPCAEAFIIEVGLDLVSDDGMVMGSMPATLRIALLEDGEIDYTTLQGHDTPVEALGGMLATTPVVDPRGPFELQSVSFGLETFGFEHSWLMGHSTTGQDLILGEDG
jgi:hypothetical protein